MKPKIKKDTVTQETNEGEVLIYDLTTDKAFLLNPMSGSIWNLCNGEREISTISRMLSTSLNEQVSEEFVFLAIDQLKSNNLLMPMETDAKFKNFNRREVIRTVGLAAAVMLPMVSSLVAPRAAHASSICAGTGGAAGATTTTGCQPEAAAVATLRAGCQSCRYRDFNPAGGCPAGQTQGTATCCGPVEGGSCV
jgi:Coenzyme PQQ synthesis protein D (PqqD)